MSEEGAVSPNGIWKWIAAILIAIILAGAPGMIQAIKAPTREEVEEIRDQQSVILQRLATIDSLLAQNQALLVEIHEEHDLLFREYRDRR